MNLKIDVPHVSSVGFGGFEKSVGSFFSARAKRFGYGVKSARYVAWKDALHAAPGSRDQAIRKAIEVENQLFHDMDSQRQRTPEEFAERAARLAQKAVDPGSVMHSPILSNMSVMYANEDFIGTMLVPNTEVQTKSAEYYVYPQGERHAFPDDEMGARAKARTIEEKRNRRNVHCQMYGLHNDVLAETLQEQTAPLDEMADATDAVNEGLAFKQEIRHAELMQDTGNYNASNIFTLGAAEKWDVDGSNPVQDIKAAVSSLWRGRGQSMIAGWCGREVWDELCQHPAILELFKFNESGLASPGMLAGFFGLDMMLVGSARKDTANEGQATRVFERIWGKNFGVCRVAVRPTIRNATFAKTFRVAGDPVTTTWFDPTEGKSATFNVKVVFDADYQVIAPDTGAIIPDAIT